MDSPPIPLPPLSADCFPEAQDEQLLTGNGLDSRWARTEGGGRKVTRLRLEGTWLHCTLLILHGIHSTSFEQHWTFRRGADRMHKAISGLMLFGQKLLLGM
ncbi:hypothetical protein BDQ12DRAFT_690019 [Crucibulum laeve]|uniref:Uncharacterized protein n=1 Tax=Crucibulum laeve TaxID=68775 RepID=A0A5C3LPA9_9AGAR|nr:hypothetical protein BDQ12DRAFT_690019 [Crucibulum laeve]